MMGFLLRLAENYSSKLSDSSSICRVNSVTGAPPNANEERQQTLLDHPTTTNQQTVNGLFVHVRNIPTSIT
jgi:hypothetical protein